MPPQPGLLLGLAPSLVAVPFLASPREEYGCGTSGPFMELLPSRLLPSWLRVLGEVMVGVVGGVVVSLVAAKPEHTAPAVKKAAKPRARIVVIISSP